MTKYHVSKSGKTVPCEAEIKVCPRVHGGTPEEARANYEKHMEQENGITHTFKKSPVEKKSFLVEIRKDHKEELNTSEKNFRADHFFSLEQSLAFAVGASKHLPNSRIVAISNPEFLERRDWNNDRKLKDIGVINGEEAERLSKGFTNFYVETEEGEWLNGEKHQSKKGVMKRLNGSTAHYISEEEAKRTANNFEFRLKQNWEAGEAYAKTCIKDYNESKTDPTKHYVYKDNMKNCKDTYPDEKVIVKTNRFTTADKNIMAMYNSHYPSETYKKVRDDSGYGVAGMRIYDEDTHECVGEATILMKTWDNWEKSFGSKDDYMSYVRKSSSSAAIGNTKNGEDHFSINYSFYKLNKSTYQKEYVDPRSDIEEMKELWAEMQNGDKGFKEYIDDYGNKMSRNYSSKDAPNEHAKIENDIKEIVDRRVRPSVEREMNKDYCEIHHSSVDSTHQRKGIAKKSYVLLAKEIAKQGKSLRNDFDQTDDAKALWESIMKDETIPTYKKEEFDPVLGKNVEYNFIDYR